MATNADGSVVIDVDLSVSKAEKKLSEMTKKIEETEEKIEKLTNERDKAEQKGMFDAAILDAEKKKLAEMKEELKEIRSLAADKTISSGTREELKASIPGKQEEIREQQERVRLLQNEWNQTMNSVGRYNKKIDEANAKLEQQKAEAGQIAAQIDEANSAGGRFAQTLDNTGNKLGKLNKRFAGLASRVMVFSAFTLALRSARSWLVETVKANDEASQAIARLKGAILTLVQPLVDVIIPAFTEFVNVLTKVVAAIASVVSALFGTTVEASAEAAENLQDEKDALNGVSTAAKKAQKSLAGFDEINRLTSGSSNAVSSSLNTTIKADFSAVTELPQWLKDFTTDLTLKINNLDFDWSKLKSSDAWEVALDAILGAATGGVCFGIGGAAIGALLGAAFGISSLDFNDETKGSATVEKSGLSGVLGAIVGGMLGSKGGLIGTGLGSLLGYYLGSKLGLTDLEFFKSEKFSSTEESSKFASVMRLILEAILGAKYGGFDGAIIAISLGSVLELVSAIFKKAENGDWDSLNTHTIVLGAIIGAILGTLGALNPTGTAIGFSLGAIIAYGWVEWSKKNGYSASEAFASFKEHLYTLLGACMGVFFGSPIAGGVLATLGLMISWATIAFDKNVDAKTRESAATKLKAALTSIIKALCNAAFGGSTFGKIVGNTISLVFELKIDAKTAELNAGFGGGVTTGGGAGRYTSSGSTSTYSLADGFEVPALATGAVIPPNREFMAVLGDQSSGMNIEAPESLLRQIVREENGNYTAILREILSAIKDGKIMMVDNDIFAQVVRDANERESNRQGVPLVTVR